MDKTKILIISALTAVGILVVILVIGLISSGSSPYDVQAELTVWGVGDNSSAYQGSIDGFNQTYPNIKVNYRGFDSVENYERSLLNALAEGRGPDIFTIRNNDLFRKVNKIYPMPQNIFSLVDLRRDFPGIVEDNFYLSNTLFALPLSVDTLALIYNEDLFNEASIVFPPENWTQFQENVTKITKKDDQGRITLSGAAIGGDNSNIPTSKDIVSALFLQSGIRMVNNDYDSAVLSPPQSKGAFDFYTSFGKQSSPNYAWDIYMPNSREAFANGEVAMILDYQSSIPFIKSKSPFINLKVASFPQNSGASQIITYANYWGYTVSNQSQNPNLSWEFIKFMTTNNRSAESYISRTGKPPALRTLINSNLNDLDLGVFSKQVLTAKSWPEPDPERVDAVFSSMIRNAIDTSQNSLSVIRGGESEVTRLMIRN
ncbi:MAG: extracellular solute-binding protein [Candidatus Paceibacterota bacterium]